MNKLTLSLLALSLNWNLLAAETDLFQAIRNGDIAYIKAHLTKEDLELRDRRGATLLMHAAAYSNDEIFKLILDAGPDINATNASMATALHWAAHQPTKARMLLEHGANPNAKSKQGITPLLVAVQRPGSAQLIALLLEKGAEVNVQNNQRFTPLHLASRTGDLEIIKLLVVKGAEINSASGIGVTPLFSAAMSQNPSAVDYLLQKGAKVDVATHPLADATTRTPNNIKNGPTNMAKITPLHNAAAFGPAETVRLLLKSGAQINAVDSRGLTPLSYALASDYPSLEVVKALIKAGAELNTKDVAGDSPLDWAEKFPSPEVLAELKAAGAKRTTKFTAPTHSQHPSPTASQALQRSLQLLESSSVKFFEGSGCVACHHQAAIVRSQHDAKIAGLPVNEELSKAQTAQLKALGISFTEDYLQGLLPGGGANRIAEMMIGLQAGGVGQDLITDAAVVAIAESQELDGHWSGGEVQHRPPMTQSQFAATARCVRILEAYSIPGRKQEFAHRIEQARAWLLRSKPITTEDASSKLLGLIHAGANSQDITTAAKALLALQHADGGWAANPHMKSDAFATSNALLALSESKLSKLTGNPYRRGIDYLRNTQFPDGSWHVRSRSIKFQPYFDSGFPFGHDQWISTAATAQAAQALARSLSQNLSLR